MPLELVLFYFMGARRACSSARFWPAGLLGWCAEAAGRRCQCVPVCAAGSEPTSERPSTGLRAAAHVMARKLTQADAACTLQVRSERHYSAEAQQRQSGNLQAGRAADEPSSSRPAAAAAERRASQPARQ